MQLFSTILFVCFHSVWWSQAFTTSLLSLSNSDLFPQASHLIQQTAVTWVTRSFRASYHLDKHLWRETSWCDSTCYSGITIRELVSWGRVKQYGRRVEWEVVKEKNGFSLKEQLGILGNWPHSLSSCQASGKDSRKSLLPADKQSNKHLCRMANCCVCAE